MRKVTKVPAIRIKGTWQKLIDKSDRDLCKKISEDIDVVYAAAVIALRRNGWSAERIRRLFRIGNGVWDEVSGCTKSAVQMLAEETGLELQNGDGRSYETIVHMNQDMYDRYSENLTPQQYVAMRKQQMRWTATTVMAALLLTLYRAEGWGAKVRLQRFMAEVDGVRAEYFNDRDRLVKAAERAADSNFKYILGERKHDDKRVSAAV